MTTPNVHISPPTTDTRPEPPAEFPPLWIRRCWIWFGEQNKWVPVVFGSENTQEDAKRHAQRNIVEGRRNVQIIRIDP